MNERLRDVRRKLHERAPSDRASQHKATFQDLDSLELEGPRSRWQELRFLASTCWEFFRGFRTFHFVGPCITVFGSSRLPEDHEYYQDAREIGQGLASLGFTVMTGGGPGIMEAANRGAREVGGRSVGCNIDLTEDEPPNQYLDRWVTFKYFFVRKVLLFKYSYGFIAMPGGMGTMDELFEALTLIQTGKIKNFPVILFGSEYWQPLVAFLREMVKEDTIHKTDLDLVLVTDSIQEAMEHIKICAVDRFGLAAEDQPQPIPILGETAPNGQPEPPSEAS